jgi:pyruvate formate lyase activating enzyme
MKAAYLQKTSFIDYPGRISAVVFTQGCNFRCPYCHNPELVVPERYCGTIRIEDIFSFLEKRRGKDLVPFMQRIRSMGFLVKLDTNGSRPQVLSEVIAQGLPDYVAMDVKAPWDKYAFVAGSPVDITDIGASVELIMGSGIPYEFRTTLVRSLLDPDDVMGIGRAIRGASLYVLQRFAASKHVESSYTDMAPMTDDQIATLVRDLGPLVERCITR